MISLIKIFDWPRMRKAKVYYSCSLLYHVIVIRIESVVRYESFPRGGKKPPPLRAREQQMHHYLSNDDTFTAKIVLTSR